MGGARGGGGREGANVQRGARGRPLLFRCTSSVAEWMKGLRKSWFQLGVMSGRSLTNLDHEDK